MRGLMVCALFCCGLELALPVSANDAVIAGIGGTPQLMREQTHVHWVCANVNGRCPRPE